MEELGRGESVPLFDRLLDLRLELVLIREGAETKTHRFYEENLIRKMDEVWLMAHPDLQGASFLFRGEELHYDRVPDYLNKRIQALLMRSVENSSPPVVDQDTLHLSPDQLKVIREFERETYPTVRFDEPPLYQFGLTVGWEISLILNADDLTHLPSDGWTKPFTAKTFRTIHALPSDDLKFVIVTLRAMRAYVVEVQKQDPDLNGYEKKQLTKIEDLLAKRGKFLLTVHKSRPPFQ